MPGALQRRPVSSFYPKGWCEIANYGYRPGGASQNVAYGENNATNYIAYVPDAMTEDGWGYAMGAAVGPRVGGDPLTVLMNMHDAGDNPVGVRQSTEDFSATTVVVSAGDTSGAKHTVDFPGEVAMNEGSKYPLSIHAIGAIFAVGMIEKDAYPDKDNYLFYYRSDATHPSADPMGYTSTSAPEGHLAVWVLYEPNVAPDKPLLSGMLPAHLSTPASLAPTFEANFRDDNETLPNGIDADELDTFQLDVRRVSDNHLMWSLDEASTSAERSARRFSRVYDGDPLSAGVAYKWRTRVRDRFGTASAYSDYATFTPGAGSVSVSAGTPTGKQETQQPSPFTAVWNHTGGLSTNAVRVRVKNRVSGSIARQLGSTGTGTIAKVVAPGGTVSITWADIVAASPTWANLPWGGDYVYEIQARDSANNWSGWSSPARAFTVNAAPAVPSNLAPNYTIPPQTSLPLLTATVTDADDTSATGLLVRAGIVGPLPVTNGAFAANATGWSAATVTGITKALTWDAAVGALAVGSAKVQITANTAGIGAKQFVTADQQFPCVVGQSYTARASLRTDTVTITPRMIVEWYTVGNALISRSEEADWTPTINVFSARTITATAPATASYFKIGWELYCDTANPLGSTWGDDFAVDNGARYLRTMTWDAALAKWKYQTTSTDLAAFAVYSFWAYAFDGTTYSGGTTVETSAAKSASASFTYTAGPTVTITSPTVDEVLDTDTPTIAWTSSTTQAARRVVLRNALSLTEYHDTGTVATGTQFYEIPAGILEDDHFYEVWVEVTDTLAAVGNSGWSAFSLDYVEPPSVPGWLVSPTYADGDVDPSAVNGQWEQPAITSGDFLHYRVNREPAEDVPYTLEETEQASRRARIGIITSVSTTGFIDYTAPSGVPLRYRIRVYVQKGSSWVSSQIETAQIQIQFDQSILQTFKGHTVRPDHRVVMEYRGERRVNRNMDRELFHRMNKRAPLVFKGVGFWKGITAKFRLHGVDVGDVEAQLRELDFMAGLTDPLLYRDGRGRYLFCDIASFAETDPSGGRIRDVDLTLDQIDVPEIFE